MTRKSKSRKRRKILLALFIISLGLTLIWAFSKEVRNRFKSPDGRYDCVIKRYRYESLIPRFPGSGSDGSIFLSIYKDDEHYGTIPIEIAWMINDLEWTEDGASIKLIGEWNFTNHTCTYYTESGKEVSGL